MSRPDSVEPGNLRRLHASSDGCSLYEMGRVDGTRVLGISHRATRSLLVDQRLVGHQFSAPLSAATSCALQFLGETEPDIFLRGWNELCVLRDSLSFSPDRRTTAVRASSFIGLGRAGIKPFLRYDSLSVAGGSPVFLADIVATGGTISFVLDHFRSFCLDARLSVPALVVIAVMAKNGLSEITKSLSAFRDMIPGCNQTILVVIEGIFTLPSEEQLKRPLFGVWDLLFGDVLALPEFTQHFSTHWPAMLERCCIYDGGNRAFNPRDHWSAYAQYWGEAVEVYESAQECLSIRQSLNERMVDELPTAFASDHNSTWWPRGFLPSSHSDWQKLCEIRLSRARQLLDLPND